MPTQELQTIIRLLGIESPGPEDSLEYQTLEIEDQTIIHVVLNKELLAYIWLLADSGQIDKAMDALLERAVEERKDRKMQAFTLVIATTDPTAIEFNAHKVFKESPHRDQACELVITTLSG